MKVVSGSDAHSVGKEQKSTKLPEMCNWSRPIGMHVESFPAFVGAGLL